jgi:hypothetical protein
MCSPALMTVSGVLDSYCTQAEMQDTGSKNFKHPTLEAHGPPANIVRAPGRDVWR